MVNSTENVFFVFNCSIFHPFFLFTSVSRVAARRSSISFINFNDSFPIQWTALRLSIMAANIHRKENLRNASKSKRKCGMLLSKGLTLPLDYVMKRSFSMVPEQHNLIYKTNVNLSRAKLSQLLFQKTPLKAKAVQKLLIASEFSSTKQLHRAHRGYI